MSVLLAVQTVSPVLESDEQEFVGLAVEIEARAPAPSIGTTRTPVVLLSQAALGTYAVTGVTPVPAAGTTIPMELPGLQDENVVLLRVTWIVEQVLVNAFPVLVVPLMLAKYVPAASMPGTSNSTLSVVPTIWRTANDKVVASAVPPQVVVNVTVVLPGVTVPPGKPLPVIHTSEDPATPEPGEVVWLSRTVVAALTNEGIKTAQAAIRTNGRTDLSEEILPKTRIFLNLKNMSAKNPAPNRIHVPGSGTPLTPPGEAVISAKSPSSKAGPPPLSVKVMLKSGDIVMLDPSLSVKEVVLKIPDNVAEVTGSVTVLKFCAPLKDRPSPRSVK